jgi:hypothetical protein
MAFSEGGNRRMSVGDLEFRDLSRENLRALKLLNLATLSSSFSDSYYRRIMGEGESANPNDALYGVVYHNFPFCSKYRRHV